MSIVVYEDFNGQKILKIKDKESDTYPIVAFSSKKAKEIVTHFKEIKKFAEDNPLPKNKALAENEEE